MEMVEPLPPGQRVIFSPTWYNADHGDALEGNGDDQGEFLDVQVGITNFPTLPFVNNGGILYLASQAHGLNYQRQSADWSQSRNLGMALKDYGQAGNAINAAEDINKIATGLNTDLMNQQNWNMIGQSAVGMVGQTISGAIGGSMADTRGAITGGAAAAVNGYTGLVNSAIQAANNEGMTNSRNAAMLGTTNRQNEQSGYVRDTNKQLADWAAKGDYGNTIAGISAKVQDAQMIQPNVSSQFGGDAMNISNGNSAISLRWKVIDKSAIRTVGEYWLRYGYSIQTFITPPQNLRVMQKFTYWKMTETYISAAPMPEGHKQVIRGILEKGVTVWVNPGDIGNLDIGDNDPLPGIGY
jgi:hypothetical protein